MTPCERYKDYIFNLLDDELDIRRRGELENHLKSCSSCFSSLLAIHLPPMIDSKMI